MATTTHVHATTYGGGWTTRRFKLRNHFDRHDLYNKARKSWADRFNRSAIESVPMWPVIDYQNRDMATRLVRWQMNIHMQQSGCTRQQKLLQVLLRSMHVSGHSHMPAEPLCSGEANHSAIVIYHISLVIFRLAVGIFHIQRDFETFPNTFEF